jgi:hypothetical protein
LAQLTELWNTQRTRVAQYGAEQALEQAFIQPVLQIIGWKILYQTYLRGRKPDYALFQGDSDLEAALAAGRTNPEFWRYPSVVADAKAWHVPLDRPTITDQQREYPPEQIEWYLNGSQLDYAILTNGRTWRLIPRVHEPGQSRFNTYLECDLAALLSDRLAHSNMLPALWAGFDDFFVFFLLLSPRAFTDSVERPSLIQRARQGSTEYRLGVGDGLKQRVFDALSVCIEGFLAYRPNALDPNADLEQCRNDSLILLYRLLFILFAEGRQLLPYGIARQYTENRSLSRFRDEIAAKLDRFDEGRGPDYSPTEYALWSDLAALFDLIDAGAPRYGVPAYNGGLFDPGRHQFLTEKKVPDRYLARVIDFLGRSPDPTHPEAGLVRVDYRDLEIQHLGSVYEGLLELRPHFAGVQMAVIRNRRSTRREETVVPASSPPPSGWEFTGRRYTLGSVYLLTDKGERRATGSYYTPNHIVDDIVEKALGPICDQIGAQLAADIQTATDRLQRATSQERDVLSDRQQNLV